MSPAEAARAVRRDALDDALANAAEWEVYESRNRRANVEYRLRPSITPLLVNSIERHGLGKTCSRFRVAPGALVSWFPELISIGGGQ